MADLTAHGDSTLTGPKHRAGRVLSLVVLWSREEPDRVGEVALLRPGSHVLGREATGPDRVTFLRHRPGRVEDRGQLTAPRLSRRQVVLNVSGGLARARNEGTLRMVVDGEEVDEATLRPGALVEIWRELLLLVELRPSSLPWTSARPPAFPFGAPDAGGFIGESPAAWTLRRDVDLCAKAGGHVLVHGPSGAGKELVAGAIHAGSPRATQRLLARNAATFPRELIDAELFGNRAGYPNAGMPDRPGLVGEADGGTLFLDEIGELSHDLQAHLLRVLDAGEYHRLGDSRARRADVRLVGATNRSLDALKHDFRARFTHVVALPGLDDRAADVPLLLRHILRGARDEHAALFPGGKVPQPHPRLVAHLVRRPWTTHVRELRNVVWRALRAWALDAGGDWLDVPADLDLPPAPPHAAPPSAAPGPHVDPGPRVDPGALTREDILAAYRQFRGVQARIPAHLGLRDRFQLRRIEQKLGITAADRASATEE